MAKILKLCSSCDESFGEKYSFCPKCGAALETFEATPVTQTAVEADDAPLESVREGSVDSEVLSPDESFAEESGTEASVVTLEAPFVERGLGLDAAGAGDASMASGAGSGPNGFHITIVEEKNVKERNALLAGALAIMVALSVGTFFYSMFNLALDVDAIDSEMEAAFLAEVEPLQIEEEKEEEAADKEGGGGGGGGKEQQKDASSGRLASQTENPVNPPTPMPQLTNPSLPMVMNSEGRNERPITNEPLGIPGAIPTDLSSGRGSGGGLGDGYGIGQGRGRGSGEGNGTGSGSGNGFGSGDGDGDGDGPPRIRVGPTSGVKIISKPRAQYTDAARQQGLQGKVVLKVTFQADGTIGAISPVSGLGAGLTERAIAAARSIKFEPAMRSGVPYSVTRTLEYSFTMY